MSAMPVPRTSSAATVSIEDSVDFVDWQQLIPTIRPGSRFLSPIWFQSWESAFLNTGSWQGPVRYMTVRLNGRLSGVLPLVVQRLSIVRFLSLPGYYMPFRDLPVKADMEDQVINSMVCRMAHVKGVVGTRIGPMENCSPTLLALKDSFRQHGWTIIELSRGDLNYLELPKSVADYVSMVSGRVKKTNYYLRLAKRRADVSITVKTGLSSNEWQETLHELQKIESESWVAASGEPRFMGEENFRFWMNLLQDYGLSRSIKIWMMYLDNAPVSFCLVLDAGPIRYLLVNGYSKSVKQYRTGHILFKEMAFDAIETGMERIGLGQGDPGHKGGWGARPSAKLIDLIAMKPGLFGKMVSVAYSSSLLKFLKIIFKIHF
jgi:hypothetical protein